MRRYFSKKLMKSLLNRLKRVISATEKDLQEASTNFRDDKVDAKVQTLTLRLQARNKELELTRCQLAECYEKIDEIIDIITKKYSLRFIGNGIDVGKRRWFINLLSKFDSNSWINRMTIVDPAHIVYYKKWRSDIMIFFKCVYDVKPTGTRDVYFTAGWFPVRDKAVTMPINQLALSEPVLGLFASNNPEGKRPYMGSYSKHLTNESDLELIAGVQTTLFDLIQSDYDQYKLFHQITYTNGVMSDEDFFKAMKEVK